MINKHIYLVLLLYLCKVMHRRPKSHCMKLHRANAREEACGQPTGIGQKRSSP
ncbi:Hypothetical protein PSEBR_m1693 [Pseudomonas brassicacearum subsp. brassicacearum NFM421]|uniref:Uncharacterized protein n=1 Tax=Pseudomonas brassicacearum (strain NFM421) TaxID=994484 RepID=F2K6G9_PSEBN|nr:Hypothetical protein PSEBR_m1693 [Pseudomonas brassicacearum subsp. brassicacearum NFM421]